MVALPLLFGVAGTLPLHDSARADVTSFINTTTAQVLGTFIAARVTRLIRSVGAYWSARRIRHAIRREMVIIASSSRAYQLQVFAVRMLDRIGLLVVRIAQGEVTRHNTVARESLRDLRLGANIIALQQVKKHFPSLPLPGLLRQLAVLFNRAENQPPAPLFLTVDQSLTAVLSLPEATHHRGTLITALVVLRHNLFPHAPH